MSRLFEALNKLKSEQQQQQAGATTAQPAHVADVSSGGATAVMPAEMADAGPVAIHPAAGSRLVALLEPGSLGGEKFRALVTRLDHLRRQQDFKSLQVTSSVIAEGKTMVSANLGITLAKYTGAKTLLIEGDLHRPTLAGLFGLSALQGITHWWSGHDTDFSHYLYRINGLPLWILAAGRPADQPSAILSSARFASAFHQVAPHFDRIVVDSTPMLPIVDANLWSRLVDGTLLVVREGVTPVKALQKGLQALDNPKLVGVVVNEALEFDHVNYEGQYYGDSKHSAKKN